MKSLSLSAATALFAISPMLAVGQTHKAETGWLELVKGYKGSAVGAQMRDVETDSATGKKTLSISIPKAVITHPDQMEEVVVVGQKPENRGPLIDFDIDIDYEFEWVEDYDADNYGLVIRLGKNSNWPIRLFMHADDGPRN